MLKAKGLCYRFVKSRKATTCALPLEPSPSTSAASSDHRSRCLSLIVKLGQRGLVDSAREVIRRVIDGCYSISEAALVDDFAVNNGIELDSYCCAALIRKLTEMGQPGLAETFYNQRVIGNDVMEKELGLRPTVAIYSSIIGSLGKQGRVVEAEETFAKMLESGIQPDEIAYMIMINAYARNGRINEANELVEEVVRNFVRPSSFTYTVLISGFVKTGMIEKGVEYLDKMLEDGLSPNVALYTSLIGYFLKKGDFKSSFTVLSLMSENEIKHDHIAYITLLSGLWRAMALKRKRQVLVEPEKGKLLQRLLQTKPILSISSSVGSKSFAMEVIGKVKNTIVPNLYLHNAIINGYCVAGRLDEAYNHLESMQKEGIVPNEVTYTILMKYHIEAGEIESAIDLYEEANCLPDKVMYSTLLKGLCESERPVDALALMLEMQKVGIVPNSESYETLLQCLCYSRLTMQAVKVVRDMAGFDLWPRSMSHTWLIYILCEEKKLREARALFAIMVQSGRSLLNCTKPGLLKMLNQTQQF